MESPELRSWPSGPRAICRRERPHPGAQLRFTDANGYRFQVFVTDQPEEDIVQLEARHRARARAENRIRCAKDTGLENFPFHDFLPNQLWLELVLAAQDAIAFFQRLCLLGAVQSWDPRTLRYRLFDTSARIVRGGRRLILRLQRDWRWAPRTSCRPFSASPPAARRSPVANSQERVTLHELLPARSKRLHAPNRVVGGDELISGDQEEGHLGVVLPRMLPPGRRG